MSSFDRAKDIQEELERERGEAPDRLFQVTRPGAVFEVKDKAIDFPTSRITGAGERSEHDLRRVIIVQSREALGSRRQKVLSVVPCSASTTPGHLDLALVDEPGFSSDSTALVSLLQPILKADLHEYKDTIRPATLAELKIRIATQLGMFDVKRPGSSKG